MSTQQDINLTFLSHKGFDTTMLNDLQKALFGLKTADVEELLHGDVTGDWFDIMVGEMRRPMLIESVEQAIRDLKVS